MNVERCKGCDHLHYSCEQIDEPFEDIKICPEDRIDYFEFVRDLVLIREEEKHPTYFKDGKQYSWNSRTGGYVERI